ncbi:cupin domain-containing protein [Kribbella yunnanensis]|uniref:Cupin domain-containing protein n=1 Tax=Kribbella yunnanensis TaxID=190194 RepID=A0ABP4U960_9ACTN
MKPLGQLLIVAALISTTACSSGTAEPSPPAVNVLLQQALPTVEGKTFTSQIVDFAPGAAAPAHRHGQAFVYAYVLKGSVRSQVDANPGITYRQGENWFEDPGAHHVVAANASKSDPAKLLVVYVSTTGDSLQTNDPH